MARTFNWTIISTCPTCGNTELKLGRVFNGHTTREINGRWVKLDKDGVQCEKCGAFWHELNNPRTGEALVYNIVQEGDLFSEEGGDS